MENKYLEIINYLLKNLKQIEYQSENINNYSEDQYTLNAAREISNIAGIAIGHVEERLKN